MKKLTKKSRWMIYLTIFISGLVIFTTVFYFITTKNSTNSFAKATMIIIIIIAILAVLSMWISRARLKINTSNLSTDFFEAYEKIADRLQGIAMSNMEKKETLADLLDLFLMASKDKKSVSDVVGDNIDEFIEQIQESFGYRSKFIFTVLTGIQYCIVYLFMMQGAEYLKSSGSSFFNVELSISLAFFLIGLAFVGIPLLSYFIRKSKILLAALAPIVILVLFITVMEILSKYFIHIPFIYKIVEGDMNMMPSIWILILWVAVFAAASILKWVQRRLSIKKL